jgi:hypothetical protein
LPTEYIGEELEYNPNRNTKIKNYLNWVLDEYGVNAESRLGNIDYRLLEKQGIPNEYQYYAANPDLLFDNYDLYKIDDEWYISNRDHDYLGNIYEGLRVIDNETDYSM